MTTNIRWFGCILLGSLDGYRNNLSVLVAPSLGLLLDETIFDHYNKRYEREKRENHGMSAQGDVHIDLSLAAVADQVYAFKKDVIYPHIVREEIEKQPFGEWFKRYCVGICIPMY